MKRILIAGEGSYIGGALCAHLSRFSQRFEVTVLDVRQPAWRETDFSAFDAVVQVAGIVHQRQTEESAALYQAVNCDLALDVAGKAKREGAGQFVYLSSMSVYGMVCGRIHADTMPRPNTCYGQSKLEAEKGLTAMADERFHVAVLRPPMVYGPGCKGNYPRLSSLVRSIRLMPSVQNERSMLYIDHLCSFLRCLLQSGEGGLFFPQNREFVSTDALLRAIAKGQGHGILLVKGFDALLRRMAPKQETIGKLFGTLTYDLSMSGAFPEAEQLPFEQTILLSEGA